MTRRVAILGSTGSIGATTLRVLAGLRAQEGDEAWQVVGLAAGRRAPQLAEQARTWNPRVLCVADRQAAARLRAEGTLGCQVVWGEEGMCQLAAATDVDVVVNGLVGAVGLRPTLAALDAGKAVAMANKEPLVMAGGLLLERARRGGGSILPVDSEPSALWQCLRGERRQDVRRLVLTASGGAFRGRTRAELVGVTPAEALDHPTWKMGPKITVDSATLMNKGFEVIEASWLFGVGVDRVDVVVHRESVVHCLVELADGSFLAHLGRTDMSLPIQYALTAPERRPCPLEPLDLARLGALHFEAPDLDELPALPLCYEAGRLGGTAPAALNAANEVAVQAFLDGGLGFLDIHTVNRAVVDGWSPGPADSVEAVLAADGAARRLAREQVDGVARSGRAG